MEENTGEDHPVPINGMSPAFHSKLLPIPYTLRALPHTQLMAATAFGDVNSPVGPLQCRWGALACLLTPPEAGSSHRSPRPQAGAAGVGATRAAVGWRPMGRCPLPTWRGPPRGHAFRRAANRQNGYSLEAGRDPLLLPELCSLMENLLDWHYEQHSELGKLSRIINTADGLGDQSHGLGLTLGSLLTFPGHL